MKQIINNLLGKVIERLLIKINLKDLWEIIKKNITSLFDGEKKSYDFEIEFIKKNGKAVSTGNKRKLVKMTKCFIKKPPLIYVIFPNLRKLRKMAKSRGFDFIKCFELLHKIKFYSEDRFFMRMNKLSNEWNSLLRLHSQIETEIIKEMIKENVYEQYIYADINDKKLNNDINCYEAYLNYWEKSNAWINKQMLKYIKHNRKPLTILDVGCGSGRVIKELVKPEDEVILVEPDKVRLQEAFNIIRNKVTSVRDVNCFIEDYNGCKADIIICSHVLQHVSTQSVDLIIGKLKDFLNDNGILFLLLPLSYSNFQEFVVHGLDFDIQKIRKDLYDNYEDVVKLLRDKGYDIPLDYTTDRNDNYKDLCVGDKVYYSISKREDCSFIYKRIYNQGLLFSVEKMKDENKQISTFKSKIKEYLKLPENLTFISTSISRYFLLSDQGGHKYLCIKNPGNKHNSIYNNVISVSYHIIYENLLNNNKIPEIFLKLLVSKQKKLVLSNVNRNFWQIKDYKSDELKAIIIKTQNYFSIALTKLQTKNQFSCTQETKKMNDLKIIDTEVPEGFWVKDNDEIKIFIRNDSDWYRCFAKSTDFSKDELTNIIKGKQINIREEHIKCETIIEEKLWKISQSQKPIKRVLPDYIVIAVTNNDYFVYRDKKYNRISRNTFNLLCTNEQQIRYKILPTHHFSYEKLKDRLKVNKLKISHFYSYHLNKKSSWIDFFLYRDFWFNFFNFSQVRAFRKKYQARDCLLVIKKRRTFFDRIKKEFIYSLKER